MRARLKVVQQCRPEDIDAVRAEYQRLHIVAELTTYLEDLPSVLAASHLVIARAGASTIAELTVAGRPAILVPLPSAMDDHQTANAHEMAVEGGARAIPQAQFTAERLASEIVSLAGDPEALISAAAHAKACGRPNATEDLADLIEGFGRAPVGEAISDRKRVGAKLPNGLAIGSARTSAVRGGDLA
jgi:UDP-N-acetylglucosamine--N-acetylmuramyl-(pentapeptide) pyrophosphoryl-undecaprenol N-acetylglucosamine transferase